MKTEKPGVLILGGSANTTSLIRGLGRKGIKTSVSASADCPALKSRYCRQGFPVPNDYKISDYWFHLLLSNNNNTLHGHVILACNDEAVEFLANNKEALKQYYLLDDSIPELQLAMLDKARTLELAKRAGCSIPEFWNIQSLTDVEKLKNNLIYPVIIKPVYSHLFQKKFKRKKYLLVNDANELIVKASEVLHTDLRFMICEFIPGPDSLCSSYHTYIDVNGNHLFDYTHKVIRRLHKNEGLASMHETKWLPETAKMGQRFFRGIRFQGMGHIEFKHDLRDGKLKVIECNPRFSAAQQTALKSGLDMGYIIYCRITGMPLPEARSFKEGVIRWCPLTDFIAFRELHRLGELSFSDWIRSILKLPMTFPYFNIFDPGPFLKEVWRRSSKRFNVVILIQLWIKGDIH